MAPPRKPGPIRVIQILLNEEQGKLAEAFYKRMLEYDETKSVNEVFRAAMWIGMPEMWDQPDWVRAKPPHICPGTKALRTTLDECDHKKPRKKS